MIGNEAFGSCKGSKDKSFSVMETGQVSFHERARTEMCPSLRLSTEIDMNELVLTI